MEMPQIKDAATDLRLIQNNFRINIASIGRGLEVHMTTTG
jgi:hypothetical protein